MKEKILKGKEGREERKEIKWREDPPHVCGPSWFLPRWAWPQDASPGHCRAQGLGLGLGLMVGLGAGDLGQGMGVVAGCWL